MALYLTQKKCKNSGMSEPIKLVTRAEQQTSGKVIEKLQAIITEIESGGLRGATQVVVMLMVEVDEDESRYPMRTNGMTNSQALWLLEMGKLNLLRE